MQEPPETTARARGRPGLGALKLLLTALVTWFILSRVGVGLDDVRALDPDAWRPAWSLLLLSSTLLFIGYALSAAIWARMVQDLGGPRVSFAAALEVSFVSNLGRYVPGKLWQIAGLAILSRRLGVPVGVSTTAAILGQAAALAGASVIGAVAFRDSLQSPGLWVVLFFLLLAALLVAVVVPPVGRRLVGLWFKLSRSGEVSEYPSPATSLRWLALYTGNWVLYAISFWVLAKSFGLPGDPVPVASAFAAAYVLGYAFLFAPAGLGVREGFLITFLSPVMGASSAAGLAVLSRLWLTVIEVVPAAFFWRSHQARMRRVAGQGSA